MYILIYAHIKIVAVLIIHDPHGASAFYYCRPPDHKCDIRTNQANYCLLKYDSISHVQKEVTTADS